MRCYSNFLKDGERRIKEIFCIKRVKLSMFKLNGHESVKKDRKGMWGRYCTMSAEGSLKGENRWPPRHKWKVPLVWETGCSCGWNEVVHVIWLLFPCPGGDVTCSECGRTIGREGQGLRRAEKV